MSKSRDKETVKLLHERLTKDPFFGVRAEAAEALRTIHTDEALAALIESAKQEDARVRHKITSEIGAFFDEKAAAFVEQSLAKEKNPEIRQDAARALGAYPAEKHRETLLSALKSDSYEEIVANGAISGLRARADVATLDALIAEVKNEKNGFNSRGLTNALLTIATIGRDVEKNDQVYQLLLTHASDLRQTVRLGAIRSLGVLRDERALAVLENFAGGPADAAETTAANRAMEQIRSGRRTGNELQSLRSEVLELKKQNDELKKSFEEIKKQMQARPATSTNAPPQKSRPAAGRRR